MTAVRHFGGAAPFIAVAGSPPSTQGGTATDIAKMYGVSRLNQASINFGGLRPHAGATSPSRGDGTVDRSAQHSASRS